MKSNISYSSLSFRTPSEHSESVHNIGGIKRRTGPVGAVVLFVVKENIKGAFAVVLFGRSVGDDMNGVPVHGRHMLCQPAQLGFGHSFIIFGRASLGQPRDNSDMVSVALKVVQSAGQSRQAEQGQGIFIGGGIFGSQHIQPIFDTIQISDCSVHVKVDGNVHYVSLLFLCAFIIAHSWLIVKSFFLRGLCPLEIDLVQHLLQHCLIATEFQFQNDIFDSCPACLADAVGFLSQFAVIAGLKAQIIVAVERRVATIPVLHGILGMLGEQFFGLAVGLIQNGFQLFLNLFLLLMGGFPDFVNLGLGLVVNGAGDILLNSLSDTHSRYLFLSFFTFFWERSYLFPVIIYYHIGSEMSIVFLGFLKVIFLTKFFNDLLLQCAKVRNPGRAQTQAAGA